jgi:glycosyltransferase involved in cell wall biosynthesis
LKSNFKEVRSAVVHDWLPVFAGAERVLAEILEVVPNADVFTLVDFLEGSDREFLRDRRVETSFIQRLPGARKSYRRYLPLAPLAIEQFDLRDYDLVVSSSYIVAKGAITGPDQLHVSYVHTPIRFAWDQQFDYLELLRGRSALSRAVFRATLHYLRMYDVSTASRPDHLVVNSDYVRRRVEKYWRRDATVIHPPADLPGVTPTRAGTAGEGYYVTVSRLVPYKRIDLIVDAFSGMPEKKLVVVGDGPERRNLEARAGSNVQFVGHVSAAQKRDYLERARAFVFAAREDFGIAPVEAMSAGIPVLAYGVGGARETVIDGETGLFFDEQSPSSIEDAVRRFENGSAVNDFRAIRAHADQFSSVRFRDEFSALLEAAWKGHCGHVKSDQLIQRGA